MADPKDLLQLAEAALRRAAESLGKASNLLIEADSESAETRLQMRRLAIGCSDLRGSVRVLLVQLTEVRHAAG